MPYLQLAFLFSTLSQLLSAALFDYIPQLKVILKRTLAHK